MVGTFTYTDGDDINDRPIYRQTTGSETAYFAVNTVPEGYTGGWIGSNTAGGTDPGDGSGWIFGGEIYHNICIYNNIIYYI